MTRSSAPRTPDIDPWPGALDDLEREVDRIEQEVDEGAVPPGPRWSAPDDLGPLPRAHARRASLLLKRVQQIAEVTGARLSSLDAQIDDLSERRRAAEAYRATDHHT